VVVDLVELTNLSNYAFSPLAALPILTAAAILALGATVLIRERGTSVSVAFGVLTFTVATWLVSLVLVYSSRTEALSLLWAKVLYLAVPLIPPALYHFSVVILGIYPRRRRIVWISWALGALTVLINLTTNLLFSRVQLLPWGYYLQLNSTAAPFVVLFVASFVASLDEYRRAAQRATPGSPSRARAESFGVAAGIGGVALVDFLGTANIPVYPFGYGPVFVFVVLVARAIVRYQLIDITPAFAAEQIVATMTDALIVLDHDWTVRLINPAGLALFGAKANDVIGRDVNATQVGRLIGAQIPTVLERGTSRNLETTYELADRSRSPQTLSLSLSVRRDARGRVTALVCVARNVTERVLQDLQIRKQAEELREAYDQLRRTQEQVIQQERLYALGTMASGIAHDFNNSLTPMLGYTELILNRPEMLQSDPGRALEWLQLIHGGATDAAQVLARLRAFYRVPENAEVHVPVVLNDLVRQAVELTRPRWRDQSLLKGQVIHVKTELRGVSSIEGSPFELREVLTNLIFNAVDAMPNGGTLTLRTRDGAGVVELDVSDTGQGMTEEVKRRCFEPFYTTKGDHGSGLGLSSVYGIVRRHQGTVTVDSELGEGTTFHLRFPVSGAAFGEVTRFAEAVSGRRVLLVDDDERVRDVIARYLAADANQVEVAADGLAGLAAFLRGEFDVVITDRGMPQLDGDRLAEAIKNASPRTRVIMLTGYGEFMAAANERPNGVDVVLTKPVTLQGLRVALAG
jgi:PAS domain S-box-containing protein